MIKVSVILPTYNSEKTIEKTIDSVLYQEGAGIFFEIELIIVDDCSTDATVNILTEKGLNFYVNEKNTGGPNKSRNIGLMKCTGDYICFLDHDDYWAPNKIIEQLKYAKDYPIVTTGYVIKDHFNNRVIKRYSDKPPQIFKENEAFLGLLSRSRNNQIYCISNIMIRGDMKHLLFEEKFGVADHDWITRVFEDRTSVQLSQNLMTRNVYHSNLSLTHRFCKEDFYFSLYFLEAYEDKYPKQVRTAIKRVYGTRARYFYMAGNQRKARELFYRFPLHSKNFFYIITSFFCAGLIKKKFHFFG